MKTFATMVGYIFLGLLLIAAVGFLLALLISLVWNAVMPQVFNLPEIHLLAGVSSLPAQLSSLPQQCICKFQQVNKSDKPPGETWAAIFMR